MNGLEVTAHLRSMPQYERVPIAAVTGYTSSEEREAILNRGFTHFLAKPFSREEFHSLSRQWCCLGTTDVVCEWQPSFLNQPALVPERVPACATYQPRRLRCDIVQE